MGLCSKYEASKKNNIVANENYAYDVSYALQYTKWLLEILGVWAMVKKDPKEWEIRLSRVPMIICSSLLAFFMIPCTMHVLFFEKNPVTRLMLIGPLGFCLTTILKYISIVFRRDIIKSCVEHLEADWMAIQTNGEREIMIRSINVGRHLTEVCGIVLWTGGLFYHAIMPIWQGNKINELNETIRPHAYPGYDIFVDSQASPNYEIIFGTHCFFFCVTVTITTTSFNLAAIFVAHACGQIEILLSRLDTIFDRIDESSQEAKDRLGFVVHLHVRILVFTAIIEKVLREICLVEVVASTLIICLLEYYCLTEWSNSEAIALITYFTLLMSLTFNIFVFCVIGELLKERCYEIGAAAYEMEWYRLPGKTGQALIMIIAMSNIPRKLTAGRMMELTVSSFGAIIKTSVVYLNMLRTVDS